MADSGPSHIVEIVPAVPTITACGLSHDQTTPLSVLTVNALRTLSTFSATGNVIGEIANLATSLVVQKPF